VNIDFMSEATKFQEIIESAELSPINHKRGHTHSRNLFKHHKPSQGSAPEPNYKKVRILSNKAQVD
jgi:hypothetical protein